MLRFSERGDNANVDMLVGDIYGQDYSRLGLKSTMIASSFGKVFKKGGERGKFSSQDISRSLLYAISNNIGQIAYVFVAQTSLCSVDQVHECGETQYGTDLLWWMFYSRYALALLSDAV